MKRILLFACSLFFCLSVCTVQAQVNDPGQVAKDAASNHANSDMDNAADQGLDKAEQGIGNLFKKKKKDKKSKTSFCPRISEQIASAPPQMIAIRILPAPRRLPLKPTRIMILWQVIKLYSMMILLLIRMVNFRHTGD